MRHDFSTDSVKPPDRLTAWQAIVGDACVPLSVQAQRDASFSGSLSSRDVDELCLSLVQCAAHEGDHGKTQVARTGGEFLLASVQMAGEGWLEQDGRSISVAANEMVLYDATHPFHWHFPHDWSQVVVRVPRAQLKFRLNVPNAYTVQCVPCTSGLGKVASDFLNSMFQQADTLDATTARRLTECAIDLVCGALTQHAGTQNGPRTNIQALHLHQACAYIAEHIRDAELDPETIARALGISVRYLHHLFNLNGISVGRYILQRRLAGCARALEQDLRVASSISAIAFGWGFNSAVHFSRVFRAEFGMSARDYRELNAQRTTARERPDDQS